MKILLVEDISGMRELIQQILNIMGHTDIVQAENGEEAWEKLQTEKIDLLMTDKQMPGMDGLELVRKVRQAPRFEHLPILMFSGNNDLDEIRSAVKSGVDTYLAKPFMPKQLLEKLNLVQEKQSRIQAGQIVQKQEDFQLDAPNPKVIFCEVASTERQLLQPQHQAACQFLWEAVCAINEMNRANPGLDLGYVLGSDVREIARLMRQFETRVKVLTVSANAGGGVDAGPPGLRQ